VVGSVVLITINALIFGFVNWLPTFFVQQGLGVAKSLSYTLVIVSGSLVGCAVGAFGADSLGRRRTIIGASAWTIVFGGIYPFVKEPWLVLGFGFLLIVGIYVLTALLYGVYTSELFPTEIRLRANGICNMFGRGATIVTPLIVVALFKAYGVAGVLAFTAPAVSAQGHITSPKEQFGFNIGDDYKLANYTQFEQYWRRLATESRGLWISWAMVAESRPATASCSWASSACSVLRSCVISRQTITMPVIRPGWSRMGAPLASMLIFVPCHRTDVFFARMAIARSRSRGLESITRSSTT